MDRRMWIVVAAIAVVAVVAGTSGKAQDSDKAQDPKEAEPEVVSEIIVEISNFQSDEGQLGCTIFSKEEGFPTESPKADIQVFSKPKSKKGTCSFDGIKPGTYAIAVMHDADMSGKLNKSFVGRPKEWWGVSKNMPAHRFSAPTFDECKFQYAGGKMTLKVKLQL